MVWKLNFCSIFKGSSLKQKNATSTPPNIIHFLIFLFLFGGKLAKNADPDKYIYSGYGIGFNFCWEFSLSDGSVVNVMIFGIDMSSSVDIDNKKKMS